MTHSAKQSRSGTSGRDSNAKHKPDRPRKSAEDMFRFAPKNAEPLRVRSDGTVVAVKKSARGSAAMNKEELEAARAEKARREAMYEKKAKTPRVKKIDDDTGKTGKKKGEKRKR
ncbi:MAG TPA: hypothetical protein VLB83_02535 [Candidatus Paceibacterota bacterium]|nr:hypothetical protein [Candidatus Paceibacterota bacterium]